MDAQACTDAQTKRGQAMAQQCVDYTAPQNAQMQLKMTKVRELHDEIMLALNAIMPTCPVLSYPFRSFGLIYRKLAKELHRRTISTACRRTGLKLSPATIGPRSLAVACCSPFSLTLRRHGTTERMRRDRPAGPAA